MFITAQRRFERSSPGQALVEAAIVLPVLVLLLLLAIDLGRVFFVSIDLRNAAHEATMYGGGTDPEAVCADVKPFVDRQMNETSSVCGAVGSTAGVVYITNVFCEGCTPWSQPYPPTADLVYRVRLEYRFQPAVPFVGLLTGNGLGGSVPIAVENRSPVLKGYEGG